MCELSILSLKVIYTVLSLLSTPVSIHRDDQATRFSDPFRGTHIHHPSSILDSQLQLQLRLSDKMLTSVAALVGLLAFADAAHNHGHAHLHRSHNHSDDLLEKRGGSCQFPSDAGLVAVTPGSSNAGWAMSPDQPCKPGNWCPYACPPGQVSMQWNPEATSYTYPQSMVCI